jgi:Protein of unknown function VcgC/VcgE (DUF2780)
MCPDIDACEERLPGVLCRSKLHPCAIAILAGLFLCLMVREAFPAPPAGSPVDIIEYVEQRFGLNDGQARGALGALLVFARDRLTPQDYRVLARNVPNAQRIVQDIKLHGIVTRPLSDLHDYETSLESVGIGQPLASQIAPAVLEYLGASGQEEERDILARVLD